MRRFVPLAVCLVLCASVGRSADTAKAAETRKRLQEKVTVDYMDTLLRDVVEDLKKQVKGLGIRIDTTGGVSMNLKITCKAEDKPLAEVLDEMFQKNGLGYVVISQTGNAYDGSLLLKQGRERGYAAGQQPDATGEKPAAKGSDKTAKKDAAMPKEAGKAAGTKGSPVEKGPEDPEKTEKIAGNRLKLANQLARDGKYEKARQFYQDIVKQYPKTQAAEDARKELVRIKDK